MSAIAHMAGNCWAPTCPYCAAEDAREAADAPSPRCGVCTRTLAPGETVWAGDWTVIDAHGTRTEVRYECDDCATETDA